MRNATSPATDLEASGGITLKSVGAVATTGVERISVGALTHSARVLDLALDWSNDFLVDVDARFPNYHMRENLMVAFEQLDLLGIPAVFVYDGSGAERYRLTGDDPNNQFTEADVEHAVETLLAEAGR